MISVHPNKKILFLVIALVLRSSLLLYALVTTTAECLPPVPSPSQHGFKIWLYATRTTQSAHCLVFGRTLSRWRQTGGED